MGNERAVRAVSAGEWTAEKGRAKRIVSGGSAWTANPEEHGFDCPGRCLADRSLSSNGSKLPAASRTTSLGRRQGQHLPRSSAV